MFFTPTANGQTFAVYLRAPKVIHEGAQYRLDVARASPLGEPETVKSQALVFQWRVERPAGMPGKVVAPKPGQTFDAPDVVPVATGARDPVTDEIEFVIRYETKTKVHVVPDGFIFDVDLVTNGEHVFEPIRLLGAQ
ncbi:MAG: hypothetical protein KDA63_17300 [Planctomycetales bacterium]|nr:hypothetical protein [Planctomycetales bacterium]